MSDKVRTKEKSPKKSLLKGFKSEFAKIIWPDKDSLVKQTIAVVFVTVALGLLIALVDLIIKTGINIII